MSSTSDAYGQGKQVSGPVTITVVNEDDGRTFTLHAGIGVTVGHEVIELYKALHRDREADDRLRCEATGEDVFSFEGLKIRDYFAQGHCPEHAWAFTGCTGGA
jgi:hypothetical protein